MMRSALSSSSESSLNIIARRISAAVTSCRGVAKVGAVARTLPSRALRADLADALPRCVEREEFSTAESVSETRPSGSCGTLLAPAGGLEEVATAQLCAFGHGENTDLFCRTRKRFLSDYHLFHLCDEQLALASDRCHYQSHRPASAVPSGQTRWQKSAPGLPLYSVNAKKAIACRTSSTQGALVLPPETHPTNPRIHLALAARSARSERYASPIALAPLLSLSLLPLDVRELDEGQQRSSTLVLP